MANKEDLAVLVKELNEQSGIALNKADTIKLVDNVLEGIKHISKEEQLKLYGFGNFETVHKEARIGRNPTTGEPVDIPAKNAPKFKFAKGFKDYVK